MSYNLYDNWIEGNRAMIVTDITPSGYIVVMSVPNDMFHYFIEEIKSRRKALIESVYGGE